MLQVHLLSSMHALTLSISSLLQDPSLDTLLTSALLLLLQRVCIVTSLCTDFQDQADTPYQIPFQTSALLQTHPSHAMTRTRWDSPLMTTRFNMPLLMQHVKLTSPTHEFMTGCRMIIGDKGAWLRVPKNAHYLFQPITL